MERNATRLPWEIERPSLIALHRISMVFFEYQYWLRSRFSPVRRRNELSSPESSPSPSPFARLSLPELSFLLEFDIAKRDLFFGSLFRYKERLLDISFNSSRMAASLPSSLNMVARMCWLCGCAVPMRFQDMLSVNK